jgi:hypothetical protein
VNTLNHTTAAYSVRISTEGRKRLRAEQGNRLHTEIFIGCTAGSVLVIAGLIIKTLLGA